MGKISAVEKIEKFPKTEHPGTVILDLKKRAKRKDLEGLPYLLEPLLLKSCPVIKSVKE